MTESEDVDEGLFSVVMSFPPPFFGVKMGLSVAEF